MVKMRRNTTTKRAAAEKRRREAKSAEWLAIIAEIIKSEAKAVRR